MDRTGALALLSLVDEEADQLLAEVPRNERERCWWLVLRDGTAVPGDRGGGVAALSAIPLTRPLGRLLLRLGASPRVDAFDRVVSRHRARLGRLVPDGPAPRRYP